MVGIRQSDDNAVMVNVQYSALERDIGGVFEVCLYLVGVLTCEA